MTTLRAAAAAPPAAVVPVMAGASLSFPARGFWWCAGRRSPGEGFGRRAGGLAAGHLCEPRAAEVLVARGGDGVAHLRDGDLAAGQRPRDRRGVGAHGVDDPW